MGDKTVTDVKAYCDQQGVGYTETSKGLIVHDTTSVSGAIRGSLDEKGFIAHRVERPVETGIEPELAVEPPPPVEAAPPQGKLPDDFPGHAALKSAGITTYAQLRKVGDLTKIDGIGEATAAKIQEALEG